MYTYSPKWRYLIMPITLVKEITTRNFPLYKGNEKRYDEFIALVNKELNALNFVISKFNEATHPNTKSELLQIIHQEQQRLINLYPPVIIDDCPLFTTEIIIRLSKELQQESTSLRAKINPNGQVSPSTISDEEEESVWTPQELIANLSSEQLGKIAVAFIRPDPTKSLDSALMTVFNEHEPGYKEFQRFLKTYSLEIIGRTNTIILKIVDSTNNQHTVLKMEPDRNSSPDVPLRLAQGPLNTVISPILASKLAVIPRTYGYRHVIVSLTEYYPGGNLLSHSLGIAEDKDRTAAAVSFFSQMAEALIDMEQAHCAFPDMKNQNWLIDEQGCLHISDTKSFALIGSQGVVSYYDFTSKEGDPSNRWHPFIESPLVRGKPFHTKRDDDYYDLDAHKMHACSFGLNLYQFLTQCNNTVLERRGKEPLRFDHPVFKTAQGEKLEPLIKSLINGQATLEQALTALKTMMPIEAQGCYNALQELSKTCRISRKDPQMQSFVNQTKREIQAAMHAGDTTQLTAIHNKLMALKADLEGPTALASKSIRTLRTSSFTLSPGKNKALAHEMEAQMEQLPIEQRAGYLVRFNESSKKEAISTLIRTKRSLTFSCAPSNTDDSSHSSGGSRDDTDLPRRGP
jgi:serine/threonine protein kinase